MKNNNQSESGLAFQTQSLRCARSDDIKQIQIIFYAYVWLKCVQTDLPFSALVTMGFADVRVVEFVTPSSAILLTSLFLLSPHSC
jgi:hypothetical protein